MKVPITIKEYERNQVAENIFSGCRKLGLFIIFLSFAELTLPGQLTCKMIAR